jgi:hypothetical protein
LEPDSEEPIASVSTMLGSSSMKRSFMDGENSAAVLPIAKSEERSKARAESSSASIIGRAMASPVIMTMLTPSSSTSSQVRTGSNLAMRTMRAPRNAPPMTPHCVAPCMRGAMGMLVAAPPAALACSTRSMGVVTRSLVTGSMPPPSAKKTSSWRHTTPLGIPVVPPV